MSLLAAPFLLLMAPGQAEGSSMRLAPRAISEVEWALDGPNWRPWESFLEKYSKRASRRSRGAQVPSATVEVVEDSDLERHQRIFEFLDRTTPLLLTAFEAGHGFRTNVQMLGEFMAQDPAHPHPPTVPSVFYNHFKPPLENPALNEKKQ